MINLIETWICCFKLQRNIRRISHERKKPKRDQKKTKKKKKITIIRTTDLCCRELNRYTTTKCPSSPLIVRSPSPSFPSRARPATQNFASPCLSNQRGKIIHNLNQSGAHQRRGERREQEEQKKKKRWPNEWDKNATAMSTTRMDWVDGWWNRR